MTSILSMSEIGTLDRQIQQLHDYKPIPENEVKALCDKVSHSFPAAPSKTNKPKPGLGAARRM